MKNGERAWKRKGEKRKKALYEVLVFILVSFNWRYLLDDKRKAYRLINKTLKNLESRSWQTVNIRFK